MLTIQHFFPQIFEQMRALEDYRDKPDYDLATIITAALGMHLFKAGSRNAMNNLRKDKQFRKNYKKLFKLSLPHMDTVNLVMQQLEPTQLEQLSKQMVRALMDKRIFHRYRLFNQWFVIAVDATGLYSFEEQPYEQALYKCYSSGKTSWFSMVLEAKLITPNGFSASVGTEWIENPDSEYEKQDCERKAFKRLAERLKRDWPRLPICIAADGLYPYKGSFDICKLMGWSWVYTFKDGNLPSVREEVESLLLLNPKNTKTIRYQQGAWQIEQCFRWINAIDYKGHSVNWFECVETSTDAEQNMTFNRFVHLTSFAITSENILQLSQTGRMRWKIENEGFNIQKNHGYELKHKYSRRSYRAMKNYYQCLQMAHLINQLLILSRSFQSLLKSKMTIKHLWIKMRAIVMVGKIATKKLEAMLREKRQIRLVT